MNKEEFDFGENFKYSEKQGRLVFKVTAYLKRDLNNKQLEKVYNELKINITHPLIEDFEKGE